MILEAWLQDLESLEAVTQDDEARAICMRMAAMTMRGQLGTFLHCLADDEDLDEATKGTVRELAEEPAFLLALDAYVRQTRVLH